MISKSNNLKKYEMWPIRACYSRVHNISYGCIFTTDKIIYLGAKSDKNIVQQCATGKSEHTYCILEEINNVKTTKI
jgi:hypothetical protein